MISYVGSKKRFADKILNNIKIEENQRFYDMCCGSGEISIALVKRGFDPRRITMVDSGPWGMVWEKIGNGKFDLKRFAGICDHFNSYPCFKEWCRQQLPLDIDQAYKFLILQACSFGGRPIIIRDGQFKLTGFRNNINPNIYTLFNRICEISKLMKGVKGKHQDVLKTRVQKDSVLFFDPPYLTDTNYYQDFVHISQIQKRFKKFYCTYSFDLEPRAIPLQTKSRRGGVRGIYHQIEYLSYIN